MATLIESADTSTKLTELVMVPVGSGNVTSRSIQSSRKIVGKLTGKLLVTLQAYPIPKWTQHYCLRIQGDGQAAEPH